MDTLQAVILAGGSGTRLRERLGNRPKPLVDIFGIPLLQRQIEILQQHRVTEILLLVSHAADQIEVFCDAIVSADIRIKLLDDEWPRGTAGALLHAYDQLDDRFLVVYGDTLFDVDIGHFWNNHLRAGADASLFLHPNDHPFDSDLVEVDETNRVVALHATPHPRGSWLPNLVNAAMYVMERRAIGFWRDAPPPSDIARDLFPAMLERGEYLHGYISSEYIKDIGTPKRLDRAVAELCSGVVVRARRAEPQKAVFLDRDGTINELRGHIARAEDFSLLSGAAEAVKRLNEAEYRVIVATNQPVLARGETTYAELRRIHNKMAAQLGQAGSFVDRIYYCPHHPDRGFSGEVPELKAACSCRKPKPGLIDQAVAELGIDLTQSWLVGDSTVDVALAQSRGLRSVLVRTGMAGRDEQYPVTPDFIADDLGDAVLLILDRWPMLLELAQPIAEKCKPGSIILIGGKARSGKSYFATTLAWALRARGQQAIVVPLDHWFKSVDLRTVGLHGHYDLVTAEAAVTNLRAGMSVYCPAHDQLTRSSKTDCKRLAAASGDMIIVEGCSALSSKALCAMSTHRVYVECPEDVRRHRFVAEYRRRGMNDSDIEALYAACEKDLHRLILTASSAAEIRISL